MVLGAGWGGAENWPPAPSGGAGPREGLGLEGDMEDGPQPAGDALPGGETRRPREGFVMDRRNQVHVRVPLSTKLGVWRSASHSCWPWVLMPLWCHGASGTACLRPHLELAEETSESLYWGGVPKSSVALVTSISSTYPSRQVWQGQNLPDSGIWVAPCPGLCLSPCPRPRGALQCGLQRGAEVRGPGRAGCAVWLCGSLRTWVAGAPVWQLVPRVLGPELMQDTGVARQGVWSDGGSGALGGGRPVTDED